MLDAIHQAQLREHGGTPGVRDEGLLESALARPRHKFAYAKRADVATLAAVIPFYNLRHEVRPGLTGWAQVKAGYSMSTEEVTQKLCYDLYYLKHRSLAFDLRILFDTVKFVLCGKRPG